MDYFSILLTLLIGIIIGTSICVFILFRDNSKNELLEDLVRTNRLQSIRFASVLRDMLVEERMVKVYQDLYSLKASYKVPDPKDATSPEKMEQIDRGLNNLDDYLSVMDLVCFAMREGALSNQESRDLFERRLKDITSHAGVCRYIRDYASFYKNLEWELDKK